MEDDFARLARFTADNDEGHAVERTPPVSLEGIRGGRITVVDGRDFAGTFNPELDLVVSPGAHDALFILNTHGDEGEVIAIGIDCCAVGHE